MKLKLMLVRGNDVNSDNQDWFVVAEDVDQAIDIWNDFLITGGHPRDDDDDEIALPRTRTVKPANIREILPDVTGTPYAGKPRAVDWNDLTIVMEA